MCALRWRRLIRLRVRSSQSELLNNSLLDNGFLATLPKDARFASLDTQAIQALKNWLLTHYQAAQFAHSSESQLERAFIDPMLTQLGWTSVPQQVYILR
jgi:hypothetical protein